MAFPTVAEFQDDLEAKTSGAKLDGSRLYSTLAEASANLLARIHPNVLRREVDPLSPFFPSITEYAVPDDLHEPICVAKNGVDYDYQTLKDLNSNYGSRRYDVRFRNGIKVLNIDDYDTTQGRELEIIDGTTNVTNVTMATFAAEAANIKNDDSKSALKVSLSQASTSGKIIINGFTEDFSTVPTDASVFLHVYIPDKTYIDSMQLDIGDGANNQSISVTGTTRSNTFENGWNLLRFQLDRNQFDISTANVTYVQFTINYNSVGATLTGNIEGIIFDEMFVHQGTNLKLLYQSNAPFWSATNGFQTKPTAGTDSIYLERDAYNILLYEASLITTQRIQAEDGRYNRDYFQGMLHGQSNMPGLYSQYELNHPDEVPDRVTRVYQSVKEKYRRGPTRYYPY